MVVKHKLDMDLAKPAEMPRVDTVHKDQYTRQLELTLYANEEPWVIPEDADILISFIRTDGTGGSYDTLPTGTQAWSAEGNVLTIDLAPDVLATPGPAMMAIDLLQGNSKISTFTIMLYIRETILTRVGSSEDYINITSFLPMPDTAEVGQYFRVSQVDDSGAIQKLEAVTLPNLETAVEEALTQAKESGEFDGPSAYEVAVENGFEGTEAEWVDSLNRPASGNWGNVIAQSIKVTGALTTDSGITVNFYGNRLQGVSNPVNEKDAANKRYVDQAVNPYAVPDYWQDAVNTAISKIHALQDAGGKDCMTFAWFADCHFNEDDPSVNAGNTGKLAAAVMDACNIPFAVLSGDVVRMDSHTLADVDAVARNFAYADQILAPIGWDRLLQAQGDYDGCWGTDFASQLDECTMFNRMFRKQTEDKWRVFGGNGSWFYVDYTPAKIRFIVLNSDWVEDGTDEEGNPLHKRMDTKGYGNEQLNWLAHTALSFEEEGWAVVVVSHRRLMDTQMRDSLPVQNIMNCFLRKTACAETAGTAGQWDYVSVQKDFTSCITGDVIGCFSGNMHKDAYFKITIPFAYVNITSDADLGATEENRVMGTDNEHAIDFVTINRAARTVSLTRLGYGSDRSYSF